MKVTHVICDICRKEICKDDNIYTTTSMNLRAGATPTKPHDLVPILPECEVCVDCAYAIRDALIKAVAQLKTK